MRSALRRTHLDAGPLFDRLHDLGDVLVGTKLIAGELEDRRHRFDDLERDAERFGFGNEEVYVLKHQPGGDALIEGTRQYHFGKLLLGRGATPRTRIYDVEHDARIEPGLDPHHH